MTSEFQYDGATNDVEVCENLQLTGCITGLGNTVHIEKSTKRHRAIINIHGDNNTIRIGENSNLRGLTIDIGSAKWKNTGARLTIGQNFSTGSRSRFILPNPDNVIKIGDDCMFSNSNYTVGEGVYITKSVTINRECVLGARSVVTRRFEVENAIIAGNPATVVKENVRWIMNERALVPDTPFAVSFAAAKLPERQDGSPNSVGNFFDSKF